MIKGEASALGFEPLAEQTEKPEISVMKLCDYTQVPNAPPVSSTPEAKGTIQEVTLLHFDLICKTNR